LGHAEVTVAVLDASVGVKWFRNEPGATEARELLAAHGRGELELVVASVFVYELMAVASTTPTVDPSQLWVRFVRWRIRVREIDSPLMLAALAVQRARGCSLYDAFAPALAEELGAPLYSADRRAHGDWPGAVLLGGQSD
jgi:predicted nucleic acid-binding protein